MNSRLRVSSVLKGEIPDRVPIGEYAIDSDTVERVIGHETYLRAKAKCRIAFWEGRRDEVAQSWKEDTIELHRKLPVFDIINLAAESASILPPGGYPKNEVCETGRSNISVGEWRSLQIFRYNTRSDPGEIRTGS